MADGQTALLTQRRLIASSSPISALVSLSIRPFSTAFFLCSPANGASRRGCGTRTSALRTLLVNILPPRVADRLKERPGIIIADSQVTGAACNVRTQLVVQSAERSFLSRSLHRTEGTEIKFDVPAVLRKWPSLKGERVSASLGARPYMVFEGILDECIRQFMSQPDSQRHLYEIHTTPQAELITAVLSADQIIELARLRDFL